MRKYHWFLLLLSLSVACRSPEKPRTQTGLWPAIEPYQSGYLQVSELHELYYELSGNPQGKVVFGLHGGPGGGSSPYMRRFFDPEKFLIVLYDQRGAGKSRPFADIRENTTQDLVQDIEKLRTFLKLDKILLFGGSWGSTLALAYTEAFPEHVSGMILRGIFTATQEEIDHFYHGGVRPFFPETYEKFVTSLPDPDRRPIPEYLFSLLQSPDSTTLTQYSRAWAGYEIKLSSLNLADSVVEQILDEENTLAFSRLENYYMANRCFLQEGQLLRDAEKIAHIPAVLVNGRYDMICPPVTAYRLHQKLPNSKLVIAENAGHWMGEPAIERALLQAAREFE